MSSLDWAALVIDLNDRLGADGSILRAYRIQHEPDGGPGVWALGEYVELGFHADDPYVDLTIAINLAGMGAVGRHLHELGFYCIKSQTQMNALRVWPRGK